MVSEDPLWGSSSPHQNKMEHASSSVNPGDTIDLTTLSDDDVDMSPEPYPRISEQKKKEIRNICKSAFGSEFMKSHSDCDADFSTLLDMLSKNEFANLNEVRREAIDFLDDQVRWFENPTLEVPCTKYQRSEKIAMAENLKQRFLDLVDDSKADGGECSRSDSKELMIVEKLQELFPQLHPSELSLKTNHYLLESINSLETSVTDVDIEFAVNEISQDILSTQDFPDGPATSDDQQG